MIKLKSSEYKNYSKFLSNLGNKLTKFYYLKLDKPFKVSNKLKGRGYDPVTNADTAFERYISKEIKKRFPDHQIIGEEFGHKKTNSDFDDLEYIFNSDGVGFLTDADFDIDEMSVTNCYNLF